MENIKNEEKSKTVFYCYKVFYYTFDVLIGIFTGIFDWWRENGMKENAEELTNRFAGIELTNLVAKIRQ